MKWIKIVVDIFDDEKILLIEALPEADSIIVIWFKLLCLAGKINNCGVLMMNERIAYTDEMLSQVFRRPINTIRLALKTFERFGMIEIVNDTIFIPNWEKHQSVDRMMEMKEYNKIKQRESRARRKALLSANESADPNVNDMSMTCQRSSISISNSLSDSSSLSKGANEDSMDTQNVSCIKDGMAKFTAQLEKPSTAAAYLMDMGIDIGDYFIAQQYHDFIVDGMEEDAIMYAAFLAKSGNKASWAYVRKILNNWLTNGITTKAKAEEEHEKRSKTASSSSRSPNSPLRPDGTYDYESGESEEWPSL